VAVSADRRMGGGANFNDSKKYGLLNSSLYRILPESIVTSEPSAPRPFLNSAIQDNILFNFSYLPTKNTCHSFQRQ
jgi:hypothetical protein